MVIRQIKEAQWQSVCDKIEQCGRTDPLSLQYDINISCNNVNYVLSLQLGNNRKIAVLQAVALYFGDSCLVENNAVLSGLFEIFLYQCAEIQDN